jgi:hypothetical protein
MYETGIFEATQPSEALGHIADYLIALQYPTVEHCAAVDGALEESLYDNEGPIKYTDPHMPQVQALLRASQQNPGDPEILSDLVTARKLAATELIGQTVISSKVPTDLFHEIITLGVETLDLIDEQNSIAKTAANRGVIRNLLWEIYSQSKDAAELRRATEALKFVESRFRYGRLMARVAMAEFNERANPLQTS